MFLCKGIFELYGGVCFNCGQLRLKDQIPYYGPPFPLSLSLSLSLCPLSFPPTPPSRLSGLFYIIINHPISGSCSPRKKKTSQKTQPTTLVIGDLHIKLDNN